MLWLLAHLYDPTSPRTAALHRGTRTRGLPKPSSRPSRCVLVLPPSRGEGSREFHRGWFVCWIGEIVEEEGGGDGDGDGDGKGQSQRRVEAKTKARNPSQAPASDTLLVTERERERVCDKKRVGMDTNLFPGA